MTFLTPAASAASATESHSAVLIPLPFLGIEVNGMAVAIIGMLFGLLFLFWRIQKRQKLDFADMITKDGRSVSLTKVLQLIGGLTSTWIMVKLTLTGGLTEALFGLYLTYVGAIEGYSKFVAAKYNYKETSVKDAGDSDDTPPKPPKG
jgi:hypothetical protein